MTSDLKKEIFVKNNMIDLIPIAKKIKENEIEKEYWKITELRKSLELLNSHGESKVTRDEGVDIKIKINLMEEAQEFGYQEGLNSLHNKSRKLCFEEGEKSERDKIIKMIDGMKNVDIFTIAKIKDKLKEMK